MPHGSIGSLSLRTYGMLRTSILFWSFSSGIPQAGATDFQNRTMLSPFRESVERLRGIKEFAIASSRLTGLNRMGVAAAASTSMTSTRSPTKLTGSMFFKGSPPRRIQPRVQPSTGTAASIYRPWSLNCGPLFGPPWSLRTSARVLRLSASSKGPLGISGQFFTSRVDIIAMKSFGSMLISRFGVALWLP